MDSIDKNIDILSFDGGGSRGIMELCILDDVFRLATIVLRRPDTVKSYLVRDEKDGNEESALTDIKTRKRLIDDLKAVIDPIQPTDVYEMIVGTSTGALIAFGLVGGKETEDGKREPMTIQECIEMYLTKTKAIFAKSWSHWFLSGIPGLSSIPLTTYSQDNVRKALEEQFGESSLEDFRGINGSKCVAGAVARKLGKDEELVLFDTRSEDCRLYKTYQVLLATSNAPVYFDTPIRIGSNDFVDGGVGGNCPLAQAIPRAKELFGKEGQEAKITSALSVAPPQSSKTEIPHRFQIKYWLNYFVNESTDGYAVFREVVKRNKRQKTLFHRLSPRGEGLKVFKLDEIDAKKMLDAMEKEKVQNEMFLIDVIATAMDVVFTSIDKVQDCHETALTVAAQLARSAGNAYKKSKEYDSAIASYKTSLRLFKKFTSESSKNSIISEIYYDIAICLKEQGKYQRAIEMFKSTKEVLINRNDEKSVKLLVDTLIGLADCYLSTFRYKDAETCLQNFIETNPMQKDQLVPMQNDQLVRALNFMGWCKQKLGKLDEAVEKYKQASTYLPNNDSRDKAEMKNNHGSCLVYLGIMDKAFEFLREAKEMRIRLSEDEVDPLVAESLNNVGWYFLEKGAYKEAHKNLKDALEMYQKTGNEISISLVLQNLARCLSLGNKDHNLALEYAQQSLEMKRKQLGDLHNPGIARNLGIVGLCLFKSGRLSEAEENLLVSSRMAKKLFGSENQPWLLEVYNILSDLYKKQGNQKTAQYYEAQAKNITDKIEEMAKNIGEH